MNDFIIKYMWSKNSSIYKATSRGGRWKEKNKVEDN